MSSNETQTDLLSLSKWDTRREKIEYYKVYHMSEKKINYLLHAHSFPKLCCYGRLPLQILKKYL